MQHSGEGFSLRALAFDDSELIQRYEQANRSHLQPWEPLRGDDYFVLENARSRVQQQWESMQTGNAIFFLVTEPESGELLGRCSYTNIVRGAFQACNLGFSLAETAQGRGLMRRALEVTNRYCFEQMGLHRIMANHMPANVRSERLLQSLGFEKEGYARAYLNIAGVWEDHVLRALIHPGDVI
ncbi:GNAT family N-acetyltransferase [Pseudomonas cannabina]|uniref:Ribosomal protein alanine acetyltransferase n=3 Tax=Pseudomonas syringae group TaxID=136849 RepID=A0A3M3PWU4_PSECA|nr:MULTISPECIES: GNAT family N-acetyltransferase [Pseudomonas syringae group]KPB69671.1 Ribosomal protein alanine acetyltransferase [Pseudomonas syringae pv. maculicola]KPW21418.1 Ribosomal protein S5-alanine acetyltransferase [Pseudomonas cannabina pv. alisalensis]MBM0137301.1 GNAT family N-acetyltransferase [Pseudomonas cannabina pv. alisalensis]QHE97857.1 GNAT family N-acetyltransferase [Pseudomonas syringae pv. maculicola str. ES4326]QQN23906.1 GNAT family N-acetyltransferase [Pseudomonas 